MEQIAVYLQQEAMKREWVDEFQFEEAKESIRIAVDKGEPMEVQEITMQYDIWSQCSWGTIQRDLYAIMTDKTGGEAASKVNQ